MDYISRKKNIYIFWSYHYISFGLMYLLNPQNEDSDTVYRKILFFFPIKTFFISITDNVLHCYFKDVIHFMSVNANYMAKVWCPI